MLPRHEQHLTSLSTRCFELVKEQTNKQSISITALLAAYTFVFGYLSGKTTYNTFDYALLIALFLAGIIVDFFNIDIVALQSGYKAEYQAINRLIMSEHDSYSIKDMRQELNEFRIQQREKYNFRVIRTTHIFIFFLLLIAWIPLILLVVHLDLLNRVSICILCVLVAGYIGLMFLYLKKQMIYRVGKRKTPSCITKTRKVNKNSTVKTESDSKRHYWVIDF